MQSEQLDNQSNNKQQESKSSQDYNDKQTTAQASNLLPETAIGVKDFRSLVEESTVFVDKSLLIKEFLSNKAETQLITYPRRWGKTVNLNMIKTFLEIEVDDHGNPIVPNKRCNTALFSSSKWIDGQKSPLNIWQEQEIVAEHFGQYPVIYISFKNVRGIDYQEIEKAIISQINEVFSKCQYLQAYVKSSNSLLTEAEREDFLKCFCKSIDKDGIKNSLQNLSKVLYHFHKEKVFILIDEYDSPINHANLKFKNQEEIDNTVELFRGILGSALKENHYLKKGLVTGILRIAKADLFSGVNNFQEYGILTEEYSRHYGFTQVEVDQLLLSYNVPTDLAQDIKNWYNGYNFRGTAVYNPWSILKCLAAFQYRVVNTKESHEQIKHEILQSYWEESGNVDFISDLLKTPSIKNRIASLIEDAPVYFNLKRQITIRDFNTLRELTALGSNYRINDTSVDLLLSYLFLSGYLTMEENSKKFRLPNNEIRLEFANKLLEYYEAIYNIGTEYLSEVTDRIQLLLDCKDNSQTNTLMNNFMVSIEELINQFPDLEKITESTIDEQLNTNKQLVHGNEDVIHGIMTYIILQVRTASILASEMYLGKGRADLVLVDNNNKKTAIIELKYNKTAKEAIDQIKTMEYFISLEEKFQVFLIGINIMPDKLVQVEYEVIEKGPK